MSLVRGSIDALCEVAQQPVLHNIRRPFSGVCVFGGLCVKMHFHLFWWPLLLLILFASSYCWLSRLCLVWIMTQGLSNLFLLFIIKCSRCPEDCAFGQLSPDGFPPEMSLQKPPGCHHMWVTMVSTSFHVAWGLSAVFGFALAFPKAGNEEKGQLAKLVQNEQCWWKWFRDKKALSKVSPSVWVLC